MSGLDGGGMQLGGTSFLDTENCVPKVQRVCVRGVLKRNLVPNTGLLKQIGSKSHWINDAD